ncbi:spermidine/putrescine transport system ATP-binding protein [Clostridium saccharoperbutylacetonicum]|uniref:Spermidine/putrescine import ATP-binding protein PotA n=1 Tax=Clostridium saccharoperbutylacetonicum N1-4(HMT) TaxID=931276 RepID=M1MZ30_9CLOT|nr:ABC transporter ATP-binding protein [Clostridium saccharoperbutylacetonicum]AGF56657.1 spermidine/putrescine import ATP-binding protein PotA [Clostridium saccharoperbutylacetonicum N1-4(HMT)]NRT62589.1 spermidine/putrescine transport system ATP-binding protein [Clostridium saccharoperbutylacetonicum]NSB25937.1 spermidine/putrescine transport system ATP-binding protein [Clostridium saccharoperbutylacetonicum]NSB45295.1 spermidine/putrescine transport system ATP-binding protein [Clostridium sa
MSEVIVKIDNVNKQYGENHVVKDLILDIKKGEFLTMLGPSGCGKTTTLRMIAGFETPTSGNIYIEGEEIQNTEPYAREVNTVFQNYALFPHMTIYDNLAFGLTVKKVNKAEIKKRVTEILELVQLVGFENRKPDQLSGGQKQRVAIGRALINNPKVLLLDEPLGALDLKLRKQMQFELKRLQKKLGITFIYVTHDQEEALTMSDRIAIMYGGNLEQIGTPKEIYETPKSKFVADFIGESNIFYGVANKINNDVLDVKLENGSVLAVDSQISDNEIIYVLVRPENIKLSKEPVEGFSLFGKVKEHIYIGNVNKTIILLPTGMEVKMNTTPKVELLPVGSEICVYWEKEDAVVIKSQSQEIFNIVDNPVFTAENQIKH